MLHLSFPTIAIIIFAEINKTKKKHWWSAKGNINIQSKQEEKKEDQAFVGSSLFALKTFRHKSFYGDHFFFFIFFLYLFRRLVFGMKRNTKYIMEHRQCLYVVKKREKRIRKKKHRKNYLLYTPKLATKKK